ncbi:multicomponent Na+:H+ antiporter subunit C [Nocardioides sp. J9]|uniref:Na(+)/H(+) antiporter subunit C n=1 Tax=Nocardioides sp. J9 TaxID=935844 RepID=UPI00119F250D|nr:Na(+)/H(+) antiporter subunit C [Nocardioides sp. J9]TWG96352.1 multicomponent Na+:H+ antiporter subunit C [Nocardioides sp. J9]
MDANLTLLLTGAAMIGCGVYLVLERSLTRVLVGLVVLSNGVNLQFLVAGGKAGEAPIVGEAAVSEMSDPLPQALVLTAIVITLAMVAFVLAMAYRSWQLNDHDDVQDDVEDAAIRRLAESDEQSDSFDLSSDEPETFEQEGA